VQGGAIRMNHDALAVLIGLVTGAAMSVAVSGVWVALHIPARLQERFRVSSSWPMTAALCAGLALASLDLHEGLTLHLPWWTGSLAMLAGGAFVGMLSSSLGEILQVLPVLKQRLHLEDQPFGYRLAMMTGKGLGALLASLMMTM